MITEFDFCGQQTLIFDDHGNLAGRTSPGGETAFTHDLLGRFKSLSSNGHGLEVARDARGLETHRQYRAPEQTPRDALTLRQNYDACGRLKSQLAGRDRQLAVHERKTKKLGKKLGTLPGF